MKSKFTFILFFLILAGGTLKAQHIPFQGKLYQNGLPVNGTQSFIFKLPNIAWAETLAVQVDSGLYSVVLGNQTAVPANLFATQNSQPLQIWVQGTALDTVNIYAPMTAPVAWNSIVNKPAVIDTSNTNEVQTLSYSNNILSISQGNSVVISSSPDSLYVNNYLQVGKKDTTVCSSPFQYNGLITKNSTDDWQAFTATCSGKLDSIQVYFAVPSPSTSITFKLFDGIGTIVQTASATYPFSNSGAGWKTFNTTGLGKSLQSGKEYTFELKSSSAITLYNDTTNPYLWDTSSIGFKTDLRFVIHNSVISASSLSASGGSVGINYTNPTAALQVGGRIKDATGWVMPVGSILPFAGDSTPEGWLFCDGSAIRRDVYPDLFAAIGTAWGNGNGTLTFNLPDLRSMFLRGMTGSRTDSLSDPDNSARFAQSGGGNTGNNVGSVQADVFDKHHHTMSYMETTAGAMDQSWSFDSSTSNENLVYKNTDDVGGNETRPKNVYVKYIIKY